MSGGHFDYKQYYLSYIADEIEQLVLTNNSTENHQYGDGFSTNYSEKTIKEFEKAIFYLNMAQIYAQRVDWLVSCDDNEETFHTRLRDDLAKFHLTCK